MTWNIQLSVPAVNQLSTQTTDSRASENADLDCGPSCGSAVGQYTTGVKLLPDEAKDIIWSIAGRTGETKGPTNEHDLQGLLSQRYGIASTIYTPGSKGECMAAIRQYLFAQQPLIALRCFSSPGTTPYHWCAVMGGDGADGSHTAHVQYMNPWGARFETQTNDDFWTWMAPNYPTAGVSLLIGIDTIRNPLLP